MSVDTDALRAGQEYIVTSFSDDWSIGGSAVNVAAEVIRLGEQCIVVGAWGQASDRAETRLPEASATADWRIVQFNGLSGSALGVKFRGGDAAFISTVGVNSELTDSHLVPIVRDLRERPLVLVTGFLKLRGLHGAGLRSIAEAIHDVGGCLALDTGRVSQPVAPKTAETIAYALESVDTFLPNEAEALVLSQKHGTNGLAAALDLSRRFPRMTIALKRAEAGASIVRNGEVIANSPAFHMRGASHQEERQLVGAGDTFNAALLVGRWIRERPEEIALTDAVKLAGQHVHRSRAPRT